MVTPESFDFGSVGTSENRMAEFQLRNDSRAETIAIHNVVVSCGCTVPKLAKHELLPGESTTLKVFFRVPDDRGEVQKSIRLEYQGLNHQLVDGLTLKLKAIVEPGVRVTPPYLLLQRESESVLSGRVEIKLATGTLRDDEHKMTVRANASNEALRTMISDVDDGWIVDVTLDPGDAIAKDSQMVLVVGVTRKEGPPYVVNVPVFVSTVPEGDER